MGGTYNIWEARSVALKMLNDRITLKFKKKSTLLAIKELIQYSADPSEEKQIDNDNSGDEDTKNKRVTRAVNVILATCAVLAIITLCIGGWVALVIVKPPKYNDSVNVDKRNNRIDDIYSDSILCFDVSLYVHK
ncbi:hypothetical protein Glove_217g151 [Diversispora epigaea]|uniref:Uncharacterized protein n=1 Tax=Diversispora epigaea TaxID=1348612 RepID=A0A397IQZ1_9GLOM|nr:hypothetical protein Glove_217g151 [Diversispora epigaea]